MLSSFIVGGGCSTFAWSLIYPLDVIKSRVQTEELITLRKATGPLDVRIRAVVGRMRAEAQGFRPFYAGLRAGLLRSVVANGGAFVVYDYVRRRFFDLEI